MGELVLRSPVKRDEVGKVENLNRLVNIARILSQGIQFA